MKVEDKRNLVSFIGIFISLVIGITAFELGYHLSSTNSWIWSAIGAATFIIGFLGSYKISKVLFSSKNYSHSDKKQSEKNKGDSNPKIS